ncbi:MAG: type I polyketide synthase, partial [Pirellulaceae bacterium]|nr:type I polyketide synthase [Pirellulaceae bacterium]
MNQTRDALAIVGLACRFPKGLDNIGQLWDALKARFNAIDTIPPDRWTADRYYSSNAVSRGKAYMRRGGFLKQDITTFDAAFFGISPRDAENMDPQQRILLEVVWESFENAGLILPSYSGRNVGVYVGGFMLDHMINQMSSANRTQINQNTAAGMMMTMLSNRISHTFDFRGPSLSIDTACSSSLVAFHYACQDLWRGACELAVVGGSNIMLRPEYPMGMCKGHFLSRDGECKSFDARADGYGRGEGAAAVLLKPLAAAMRDGDPILATVLGTGSNQDGHTPGISMPSGEAQRALVEQVCKEYAIDPADVRYVECHGTGTAIGDPTEAGALGDYYGRARKAKGLSPLVIGSIKSNIGHLEAAAGVAAVVKAVLTLKYRSATPIGNLLTPNPAIPLDDLGIRLADGLIPLANSDEPFCVAINSFGYGGSNAHAVLQSVPTAPAVSSAGATAHSAIADVYPATHAFPYFLPITGRSHKAVSALASKYANMLRRGTKLDDLLYSTSFKRAALSHRAVVKANDLDHMIVGLETLAAESETEQVVRGVQPYQGQRKPVFVFTGMGPQWWGMGQELYRHEAIYREAVDEADHVFKEVAGFSALAEMLKPEADSRISDTRFAQPANLLIQIGIMAVMRAAGVEPGAVVGHSVGELAAAYAAGVLNLRDVMTVCFHRSRLQAMCAGKGSMLAVGLSKEEALERIADCSDRVSVAAVNGPSNVTLAGDTQDLSRIAEALNAAGIFHRKLEVEVAYHSPMMEPIMEALHDALVNVTPREPSLPLYSTVTGQIVHTASYGAEYWPLNIRQSVEFAPAIASILEAGFNTFLEIGPHPVLTTSLKDCIKLAGKDCRTLFTLRRNAPERANLHRAIISVFAEGCDLDWSKHNAHGKFITLPNYAWQREKYWLENDRGMQDRIATIEYPILGIQEAPATPVWRIDLDHEPVAYLRDHVVTGMPVLPGAAYVEALLELAGTQFPQAQCLLVRNLQIHAPMLIFPDRGLDSVTSYDPQSQMATIRGLENGRLGSGQVHITAQIAGIDRCQPYSENVSEALRQFKTQQDVKVFYRDLDQMGLSYGPAFQTVRELRLNDSKDQVFARIEMQPELTKNLGLYRMHPTVLDACFQTLSAMLGNAESTYLPTSLGELRLFVDRLPARIWCWGKKTDQNSRHIDCDLTLMNDEGLV